MWGEWWGAYKKMHLRGKILGAEEKKAEFRAAGLGQAVRKPSAHKEEWASVRTGISWPNLPPISTSIPKMMWRKGRALAQ